MKVLLSIFVCLISVTGHASELSGGAVECFSSSHPQIVDLNFELIKSCSDIPGAVECSTRRGVEASELDFSLDVSCSADECTVVVTEDSKSLTHTIERDSDDARPFLSPSNANEEKRTNNVTCAYFSK